MGELPRTPRQLADGGVLDDLPSETLRHSRMVRLLLETRVTADDFALTVLGARVRELVGCLWLDGRLDPASLDEGEFGDLLTLRSAADVAALELASRPAGAERMLVILPGREGVERASTGPLPGVGPRLWIGALLLALARGRDDLIADLLHVWEPTRAAAGAGPDTARAEALRAVLLRSDGAAGLVDAAKDAAERAPVDEPGDAELADRVRHLVLPELEVLGLVDRGSAPGTREALAALLDGHVAYWSHGERRNRAEGWFSLPGLGLVALARACGVAVDVVDSPLTAYLPLELVTED